MYVCVLFGPKDMNGAVAKTHIHAFLTLMRVIFLLVSQLNHMLLKTLTPTTEHASKTQQNAPKTHVRNTPNLSEKRS